MGVGGFGLRLQAYGCHACDAQNSAPCVLRVPVGGREHYARGVRDCPPSTMCVTGRRRQTGALAFPQRQMAGNRLQRHDNTNRTAARGVNTQLVC